jgi:hypothetical protein
MDESVKRDRISAIGIDECKRLWVSPAEQRFPYIYREAMEVDWDAKEKRLITPHRPEWSHARWFAQIISAAREQGTDLYIDGATTWRNIDDEQRASISAPAAMAEPIALNFDAAENAALSAIDQALHENGWAAHVSVERELSAWRNFSMEVDRYTATIYDYTNDLTTRDALEIALQACHGALLHKLRSHIQHSDALFLTRTEDDHGSSIGRYYRIDSSKGWWWRRKPTKGALAEYLAETD